MQPWQANGGPDADELRNMVRAGLTDRQIGEKYGVTRQAVSYWRGRHRIDRGRGPLLTHKQYLPWTLRTEDAHDSIAKRLREYSTRKQGGQLSQSEQRRLDEFLDYLKTHNAVVDYFREPSQLNGRTVQGFVLRRRDPSVDKRGDIVRRPAAA